MKEKRVEVLFSPAEYEQLAARDLSDTVCVVFDVLRATTTILTALQKGASAIRPVSEIDEAVDLWKKNDRLLLAGERGGLRILAGDESLIDFHFGNSPREFTTEKVLGREIVITTTNGTRALRACAHAAEVWVGAFRNLSVLAQKLLESSLNKILIVCAGTADEASLEDTLAAGGLCESLGGCLLRDSAQIAHAAYLHHAPNLIASVNLARNGRKLLSNSILTEDIPVCFSIDSLAINARLHRDGRIIAEES